MTPRAPRGYSAEAGRGDAAAATWIFHGGRSRRRRGCHVDIPCAAATTWTFRGLREDDAGIARTYGRDISRRPVMLEEESVRLKSTAPALRRRKNQPNRLLEKRGGVVRGGVPGTRRGVQGTRRGRRRYTIGDFVSQVYQGRTLKTVDLARSARSGAAGFVGHGPLCHYWMLTMEQRGAVCETRGVAPAPLESRGLEPSPSTRLSR